MNISLLGYFKYTNFFIDTVNSLFHTSWDIAPIALPLAISFFTFQQIAWLMDQYHNNAPECTFTDYVCAVSFFPHLVAGPIIQYHDLIPQIKDKRSFTINWDMIANGLFFIGVGVFKKIVIADTLSSYVVLCFDELDSLNMVQAWVAVLSYTMQIYFDFSGYCDIAMGSALLMGIKLPLNFFSPYQAVSIQDFWRRWHITLGHFLTRYLYFPLGGSRRGLARTCCNLLFVMFISGLWHGAGFTFVLWGIMHGLAMVIQRIWSITGARLPKVLAQGMTFLFVALAWVLFRAKDFGDARKVYGALVGFGEQAIPKFFEKILPANFDIVFLKTSDLFAMDMSEIRLLLFTLLLSLVIAFFCKPTITIWENYAQRRQTIMYLASVASGVLFVIAMGKMLMIPYTEFIYFNF